MGFFSCLPESHPEMLCFSLSCLLNLDLLIWFDLTYCIVGGGTQQPGIQYLSATMWTTLLHHILLPPWVASPQATSKGASWLCTKTSQTKSTFHDCKLITSDVTYSNGSWCTQNFDILQNILVKYSQEIWISESSKINPKQSHTHSHRTSISQENRRAINEQPLCFRKRPVITLCTDFLCVPESLPLL